jgi:hypothetical protein
VVAIIANSTKKNKKVGQMVFCGGPTRIMPIYYYGKQEPRDVPSVEFIGHTLNFEPY